MSTRRANERATPEGGFEHAKGGRQAPDVTLNISMANDLKT